MFGIKYFYYSFIKAILFKKNSHVIMQLVYEYKKSQHFRNSLNLRD